MVFMGVNDVRSFEEHEKLKKLEEKLVELKLVTTPRLESISSASVLAHLGGLLQDEPTPPDGNETDMVMTLEAGGRV